MPEDNLPLEEGLTTSSTSPGGVQPSEGPTGPGGEGTGEEQAPFLVMKHYGQQIPVQDQEEATRWAQKGYHLDTVLAPKWAETERQYQQRIASLERELDRDMALRRMAGGSDDEGVIETEDPVGGVYNEVEALKAEIRAREARIEAKDAFRDWRTKNPDVSDDDFRGMAEVVRRLQGGYEQNGPEYWQFLLDASHRFRAFEVIREREAQRVKEAERSGRSGALQDLQRQAARGAASPDSGRGTVPAKEEDYSSLSGQALQDAMSEYLRKLRGRP